MKVVEKERFPWVVAVSRIGDKLNVYLSEDVPEPPEYQSNNGAVAKPDRPALRMPRSQGGGLYKLKQVDKAIDKMQALADKINAAEAAADEKIKRLAMRESGW
jgi:hypothetical protein